MGHDRGPYPSRSAFIACAGLIGPHVADVDRGRGAVVALIAVPLLPLAVRVFTGGGRSAAPTI